MWPWLDRGGRFSPLKSVVLALLFAPGQLGARPINEVILHTGLWTIRLLLISLAVTPLRRLSQVAGLNLLVGVLTLGGGLAYDWLAFHADPLRLLDAAVSLRAGIRPDWIVLAAGAALTALAALRAVPPRPGSASARSWAAPA